MDWRISITAKARCISQICCKINTDVISNNSQTWSRAVIMPSLVFFSMHIMTKLKTLPNDISQTAELCSVSKLWLGITHYEMAWWSDCQCTQTWTVGRSWTCLGRITCTWCIGAEPLAVATTDADEPGVTDRPNCCMAPAYTATNTAVKIRH